MLFFRIGAAVGWIKKDRANAPATLEKCGSNSYIWSKLIFFYQSDKVNQNKNPIENNTIDRKFDEFENGVDVSFENSCKTKKGTNYTSPLHRILLKGNFLRLFIFGYLLDNSNRDLKEVIDNQQIIRNTDKEQQ